MADKTTRILQIYSRLRRGPVTIEILKKWAYKNGIHVSERSLYRDLRDLEKLTLLEGEKVVVSEGEKNRKTWKIEFDSAQQELSEFDINSYALFKNFAPLPVVLPRLESLEKIEQQFYAIYSSSKFEHNTTLINSQFHSTHFHERLQPVSAKLMEDMLWCIKNCRELEIISVLYDFTSFPESFKVPVMLMPLQLVYHRGELFVAGCDRVTNEAVVISLGQIGAYRLTNDMFQVNGYLQILKDKFQERFGISDNMDDRIYSIRLEFAASAAAFVKTQYWHTTQEWSVNSGGNAVLSLRCGINRELVGWIMMLMRNVRVLEPPELKQLVLAEMEAVMAVYDEGVPLSGENVYRKK